ncbi:hypothetical protein Ocin01_19703 [Orchesella cincta]|uniref:Uncharacterized protein n=1 Tax=Orchesella cincta TaxID=48709 RepID=A0A1D2M1Z1_ORCCI|nr:hypothetical protein Ocin01_19703 [Orchesella cincta]
MLFNLLFLGSLVFTVTISQNVTFPNAVTWVLGNSADHHNLTQRGKTSVGYDGREIETSDNQALQRGSTSWVPVQKNSKIPSSAVVAGIDPRSRLPEYVCRGYLLEDGRPWLIVGKYVEDLFACRVAYDGEVPIYSFEILIESGKLVK